LDYLASKFAVYFKIVNMKHLIFCLSIISSFSVLLYSCQNNGSSEGDDTTLDQTEFLENIGENLIVDGYEDFLSQASDLNTSALAFEESPNISNLDQLRASWLSAYLSWQRVAFYNFGPAESNAILSINYYPTDTSLIHSNISSGSYDLNTAGATFSKGFPALDYLLYGYASSDQEIVDKFINNENALTYLTDLTANILSLADGVSNNWSSYVETFKNNKGTSSGSSLSLLVNAWSQYMEVHVRNAKIGTPNGNSVVSSERLGPFPEKAEAFYSPYSLELLKEAHSAITNFYMGRSDNGTDGVGIYDLLVELNAQEGTLAGDYKDLLDEVTSQLNAINVPLEQAIEEQGEDVTAIFDNYKAIVALLKVDIVSSLSISITYADNDGD